MKIASYNVENPSERSVAFASNDEAGRQALIMQSEIDVLLRKAVYGPEDRARVLDLLTAPGLRDSDDGNPFVLLRQNRGQLLARHHSGDVEFVASGVVTGWGGSRQRKQPVDELTTEHTARVITEVDADIRAVVEAENRHSLRDFSRVVLRRVGGDVRALDAHRRQRRPRDQRRAPDQGRLRDRHDPHAHLRPRND